MKKVILTILVTAILASCRSIDVHVEYNNEVDFFKFRTFDWMPMSIANDSKNFQSLKNQSIKNSLKEILAEKNLTRSDKADLLIAVNITEKEKVYYTSRNNFYGYYRWGYQGFNTYEPEYYKVSTLFIAMVDPATKKAVWEGTVEDWQYESMSEEKRNRLLRALLEKYPPMATGAYQEVK